MDKIQLWANQPRRNNQLMWSVVVAPLCSELGYLLSLAIPLQTFGDRGVCSPFPFLGKGVRGLGRSGEWSPFFPVPSQRREGEWKEGAIPQPNPLAPLPFGGCVKTRKELFACPVHAGL